MRFFQAQVTQVTAVGARVQVRLRSDIKPRPGQFCLAPGGAYLRRTLFPAEIQSDGWAVELDEAPWPPGADVELMGPAGLGFTLPDSARNILLITADASPARLLPLANDVISRGGAVTLLAAGPAYPLERLAPEIEVRKGDTSADPAQGLTALLPEALAWADAVFVEPGPVGDSSILAQLSSMTPWRAAQTQVLLAPPMPCGVGACGACAVRTQRGWKLACVDGPVLRLSELGF